MRVFPAVIVPASLLLFSISAFAAVHPHHHSSTQAIMRHSSVSRSHHSEHAVAEHFVPSISPERATEIQSALITRGYLTGTPSGIWDASSIAAMQKLQGDNGWQTKLIPDSRALIKLGLGPNSSPASPLTPGTALAPSAMASAQTSPAY
ncbi:MAG: peptidoglycan-binding domain-containing protein [Janthinobacterium lividum]